MKAFIFYSERVKKDFKFLMIEITWRFLFYIFELMCNIFQDSLFFQQPF